MPRFSRELKLRKQEERAAFLATQSEQGLREHARKNEVLGAVITLPSLIAGVGGFLLACSEAARPTLYGQQTSLAAMAIEAGVAVVGVVGVAVGEGINFQATTFEYEIARRQELADQLAPFALLSEVNPALVAAAKAE